MAARTLPSRPLLAALLLAAALIPATSLAQDATARTVQPVAERREWGAKVRTMRAAERAELDSLGAAMRLLPAGPELARAQRELEAAKRAWRRRALEAQLQRAQANGRPEQAARLRANLGALDARAAERAATGRGRGER